MATFNQEAIETFISITGAPESVAVQRLQEYGGNINEAVNAHFSEGDRNVLQEAPVTVTAPPNDRMDIDDPPETEPRGPSSLLSATRRMNPFSLLDPTFRSSFLDSRNLFQSSSELTGCASFASQPREVREVPIEVKDGYNNLAAPSGQGPKIEDVTDTIGAGGPEVGGTVIIDDENNDGIPGHLRDNRSNSRTSAPQFDDTTDYANDIEEEMVRAAIEASKRDAELQSDPELHNVGPQERLSQHGDVDLAHAVSLSLKTADQEKLQRELSIKTGASGPTAHEPVEMEELGKKDKSDKRQGVCSSDNSTSSHHEKEAGNSSIQGEVDEVDEQPMVRSRSRRRSYGPAEAHKEVGEAEVGPTSNPPRPTVANEAHLNGNAFPSDEWGGISSEEHDEAVMLEAAMFGGIPESGYHLPYATQHQLMRPGLDTTWRIPRPPSPGLVAQRAIREQQDDEYLAALQADREKEIRAVEEEKVAREAALEEQRRKEEESQRKLEEEQELERQLAAKQASLPEEPPLDNDNAVTLLVRMPDGSRRGRRFLKSDKLQSLFDFIDMGRAVKPGTYRVVRPYPRQAFSDGESNLTLNELGLTSKPEALFLEVV